MIKKILLGLLAIIIILATAGYLYYRLVIFQSPLISDSDRAAINIMPLPAELELKNGTLVASEGIHVIYQGIRNDKIDRSVDRLFMKLERRLQKSISNEQGIEFTINCLADSPTEVQQVKEDESYSLKIDRQGIYLEAPKPYGVIRGLETIFQLSEIKGDKLMMPGAEIQDSPRFPWRGIMIDVCRHWIPKDVVLRTLDAMAMVKMNVFHWHLSEDQGFRVESKVFPKLHEIGSNGKYYTQEEIREVIQYAADRGIRVVPEFDLPGHSKSWQIAYPELSFVDFELEFGAKKGMAFAPPFDPTNEETYQFLDLFIEEMAALFPDPYFHIGGDEVNPKYWNESVQIQKFMGENGMEDHHDLQAYFNKRMNQILKKHGKGMLGWDEILHPDLGQDIIVQSWRSHKSLFEAVQNGGTGILSAGLYLDHILSSEKHYKVDPLVLEGAVDLVPDTSFWKMYDLTMDIAGNEMNSELVIFDRDPSDISGFFAMMGNRTAFKNGIIENNTLSFKFDGPAGEMKYEAEIFADSIVGRMSLGLLGFDNWGPKIGGSDMPGTEMPKIEITKPLTEEEKSRIIGGEACQWSEFVDEYNIESRLWPRSAAIAEKLWSPQELTNDIDDMYRRLSIVSDLITEQGSTHSTQYVEKLNQLVEAKGLDALKTLVDILEEVKFHGRMPNLMEAENLYLPDYALDRIVDAARTESMEAREFNGKVAIYLENPDNEEVKAEVKTYLQIWSENHEILRPYIATHEKLMDIENISLELALVSKAALATVNETEKEITDDVIVEKLVYLETGEHGVIVAVVQGLRRILNEISN